jgi:mRNA interferase HigB
MHVITKRHLVEAGQKFRDAARELEAWYKIARSAGWRNINQLRETFKDADDVDGYVVFNIRHNRYRLVTRIDYVRDFKGKPTEGHIFVRSVLTHKEYDNRGNWDKGVLR